MNYQFDFDFLAGNFGALWEGLKVTLELSLIANVMGITLGFGLCLLVTSRWFFIRIPAQTFIEFFRCTPVLLQIIWFFYCVPILFNIYVEPITMGILALGFNLTAFNAEAYRASIQAIPKEQHDACIALSLKSWQKIIYIILPQAFRNALPVLMTNGISILQQSALVSIVAIGDLMYVGKSLATDAYRPLEAYSVVALIYFAISLPLAQIIQYIERRHQAATE